MPWMSTKKKKKMLVLKVRKKNFMIKTEYIISELREMRGLAECIASIAETAVGEKSAAQLRSELYGQTIFKISEDGSEEEESSLLSRLDSIEAAWEIMTSPQQQQQAVIETEEFYDDTFFFGNVQEVPFASSIVEEVIEDFVVERDDVLNAEVVYDTPFQQFIEKEEQQQAPTSSTENSLRDFLENQSKQKVVKDPNPPQDLDMHYAQVDDVVFDADTDVVDSTPVTDDAFVDFDPVVAEPKTIMDVEIDYDANAFDTTAAVSSSFPSADDLIIDDDYDEIDIRTVMADVVIDDDFYDTANNFKEVQTVSEEEMMKEAEAVASESAKKEDNILILAILRTLDVVFFVTEKAVTLGVPGIIASAINFQVRYKDVQQDGLGSEGWELLTNFDKGAKRY
uniref:Uncharacterized protein n=2 Tax=Ditylum brightwellii TaxID=49249 RepID=A0A6V2H9D9_9STRA